MVQIYQTWSKIDYFFLSLVGRMLFFFPLAWAGTSNSCTAGKENSRKADAEIMHVPHSARRPLAIDLPTSRMLGWRSTKRAIDSLALESANLLSNLLTYFFYGCTATNPFLHVLAPVLFSPCCLCFGWLLCFGFAACRAVSGDHKSLNWLRICKTFIIWTP